MCGRRFVILFGFASLAACSGAGSAASTPPQHASASGADALAAVRTQANVRNPLVQGAACSGNEGFDAFIGADNANASPGAAGVVVGGTYNTVCDSYGSIVGGTGNSVSSGNNTSEAGFIGAGAYNTIAGAGQYGGIVSGYANGVSGEFGFVGGGQANTASGEQSAIGGGYGDVASAQYATIAGGNTNSASGVAANVAGGANNIASGGHATVLGGSHNTAAGSFSLAAGLHSDAATPGSFVWTDESDTTTGLTATVANQFLARAAGGFTLWTNAAATVGATLAPGSGAWASTSDRNMKTNVVALDDAEVLDRVGRLPISSWSYVTERGVRHMGPMAQDFYAAFNVGEDDRHITAIDEDGVALASIKALRDQNESLRAQMRQMRLAERDTRATEAAMQREIARLALVVDKRTR